ncbi:MAG: hypothetical protein JW770_02110 [Actinobacteria bacterium]|nr:hypothetical protein [Actinomycetota bacterium]
MESKENKLQNPEEANPVNDIFEDPRKIIAQTLVDLGKSNPNVVFISCDSSLGASGEHFRKNFPERHFEMGIAEQSSMSTAAGFALSGKIPYITAYVPFITFRCFEQIRDDVCKTNLNVNIMGNNCGLSVSSLGPTHVILEDVSAIRAFPNITIISPADGPEYPPGSNCCCGDQWSCLSKGTQDEGKKDTPGRLPD